MRNITYGQAIREALQQSLERDNSVFLIGEGVPDPLGVFGTTSGLKDKYPDRVLDMPIAENGLTGICIGAALSGLRPVMTHQRIDFGYLAFDQLANNAAKWSYTFDGKSNVPLVVRFIIGRGWGQGPQHSQNIHALFAHIPGLKVIMPSTGYDAKGMLAAAIEDNNPVIFIEHRWLHYISDNVPEEYYTVPLGKANVLREGSDITIASTSYMTVEAVKAAEKLSEHGIKPEIVDIRTLKPLDDKTIINSVKKTGRLLVLDSGYLTNGFAGEIIARVTETAFNNLKTSPRRITLPDLPTPTSKGLTKYYYPSVNNIVQAVLDMLGKDSSVILEESTLPWDQPDKTFTGPF